MKHLLPLLLLLSACSRHGTGPQQASSVQAVSSVQASCQLQSVQPMKNYSLNTYYCSQYSPACQVQVASSPGLDEVPAILWTNCPRTNW